MKKVLRTTALITAALLLPVTASATTASEEEILRKLEYLTNKVMSQQEHIEALEAKLAARPESSEKIEKESKAIVLANSAINQLKIKGDLRLRYENRDRSRNSKDDDSKNRLRTRLRIGGVWQNKAENWEIGVGLASGGSDATSTNSTWSENEVFETNDIRLDYAYAKHTMGNFSMIAGQQKNPYKKSWLYWDSDVRPAGLTLQYSAKTGPFITGGAYAVRYYGGDHNKNTKNTGMMGAGQFGWQGKIGTMKFIAATGLQYWESSVAEDFYTVGDDYNFTVADLYTKLTIPAGKAKIDLYTHIWNNFGADGNIGQGTLGGDLDPEDETLGYVIGTKVKIGAVQLKVAYSHIEADSLFGEIKDGDFGTGLDSTNIEGFSIRANYALTKNVSMGATAQFFETLEEYNNGSRDVDDDVKLYQVDMKYKF